MVFLQSNRHIFIKLKCRQFRLLSFCVLWLFVASAYGSYKMPKDPGNLGGGSGGGTGGGTIQVNSSVFVLLILFRLLDYCIHSF